MQNSELYRRGFVVPLSQEAEGELRACYVNKDTDAFYFELSEVLFNFYWENGLFHEINKKTGSLIDDFEEERIEYSKLQLVISILDDFKKRIKLNTEEMEGVKKLKEFCCVGTQQKTSVYFIL